MRLTLKATFELQCGWPGPSLAVRFPAGERLPATIAPAAVLVNGIAPASVARSGDTVTLTLAQPPGPMCLVIGPGEARVVFTRGARIENPRRAGRYPIAVRHGGESASAAFRIR